MGQKRIIYNKKYYKASEVIRNKKFLSQIRNFKNLLQSFGCSIPIRGFSSYRSFLAWNKKLGKSHSQFSKSDQYKTARRKIINGRKRWPQKVQKKLDKLDQKLLPPVNFMTTLKQILEDFGFDPDDKYDKDWITNYVFFNKKDYIRENFELKMIMNNNRSPELWIRIFGYTTASDLPWSEIKKLQKDLPNFTGKNKQRNESILKRDHYIVDTYLNLNNNKVRERMKKGNSLAQQTWLKIRNKYPGVSLTAVKKIITSYKHKDTYKSTL